MGNTFGLLAAEASDKENLYPHAAELIVGAVAFAIIFFFMWKWVLPRVNVLLEERRQKIQGEMEKAEQAHHEADEELAATRRSSPTPPRRRTASSRRRASRPTSSAWTCRRVPSRSRRTSWPGRRRRSAPSATGCSRSSGRRSREIAVELAGKVVGQELDPSAHTRLIDEYIDQVASGNGKN